MIFYVKGFVIHFLFHHPEDHPEPLFSSHVLILFVFADYKGGEGGESEPLLMRSGSTFHDAGGLSGAAGSVYTSPAHFLPMQAQNCARQPTREGVSYRFLCS
jgi:hypothetical protein